MQKYKTYLGKHSLQEWKIKQPELGYHMQYDFDKNLS